MIYKLDLFYLTIIPQLYEVHVTTFTLRYSLLTGLLTATVSSGKGGIWRTTRTLLIITHLCHLLTQCICSYEPKSLFEGIDFTSIHFVNDFWASQGFGEDPSVEDYDLGKEFIRMGPPKHLK